MHAVQRPEVMERGWKPNVEISPHCPRCGSSNTKFCYYNNYSLTQPRYFCKGCRRYWTKGGSLRNVPVGGGCRKHRRGKTTVRTSLSDHAPSRSNLAYGHHPYGLNGNPLIESSSSMHMMPNGSNIDLAVVYANFLNQQPDQSNNNAGVEILPAELPFDQFSISIHDTNFQLQQENIDLVGCTSLFDNQSVESHFCESHEMYLCGFDSIQKQPETCNYGLPGHEEDIVGESQEMSWLSSQVMGSSQMLQSTQLMPGIEHEAQDLNQLVGNWSPFDLSSYNVQSTSPRP